MIETETVVVGAGPAGLAVAGCLARAGRAHALIERKDSVGSAWRGHYDRLHLHTDKGHSALPYHPWPASAPKYPPRDQVVAYLEDYARAMQLHPRLGETVDRAERDGDGWRVQTSKDEYRARTLVVASGYTEVPVAPELAGFSGEVLHSSRYGSGAAYAGKRVLVVGFGNSGGEIAIDLVEQGATVALSVRSAVNVIKRDLLGLPVLTVAGLLGWLPPIVADALAWPLNRLTIGNIEKLGLEKLPYGAMQQVTKTGRIPLIDIGTLDHIRARRIAVHRGIASLAGSEVVFSDGTRASFDAIVLATGYRPGVAAWLAEGLDEKGVPTSSGVRAAPGLYFCGFYVSPFGMLRAIDKEARAIAADITAAAP